VDTETAIRTQIEPKLIGAFGRQVANSLLTRATLCYVTAQGGEENRYEAFVHSICSDPRIVRAWGTIPAAEKEKVWGALYGSEPHLDGSSKSQEEDVQ
jgi:hypothetical protein